MDKNSVGFSIVNNYWCDLLNETTIKGDKNPGKPVATAGMLVVCLALAAFWYMLPDGIGAKKPLKTIIQATGMASMAIAFFLFLNIGHDIVINIASMFGMAALVLSLVCLLRVKWYSSFWWGIFNIALIGLNNFVYYIKEFILALPLVQKLTFGSFLFWICFILMRIIKLTQSGSQPNKE